MVNGQQFENASLLEAHGAQEVPFGELAGSLMYLATTTHPNIMYAVARLAQYFSCWSKTHWKAAKKVACYVSRTKGSCLEYCAEDSGIVGFTDGDYAGDKNGRKSTGGFVFTYNDTAFC